MTERDGIDHGRHLQAHTGAEHLQSSRSRLLSRVVLITGGTAGIGKVPQIRINNMKTFSKQRISRFGPRTAFCQQ